MALRLSPEKFAALAGRVAAFAPSPDVLELALPYPVSVNRVWRTGKHGTHRSRAYDDFIAAVAVERQRVAPGADVIFSGPVAVDMVLRPKRPKRFVPGHAVRRMDVDAPIKGTLDALEAARVFADDAAVIDVRSSVGEPVERGALLVRVRAQ